MTIYKKVLTPLIAGLDIYGAPRYEHNIGGGSIVKHVFLNTDRGIEYGKSFGGSLVEAARKVLADDAPEFGFLTAEQREDLNTRPDLTAWVTRHGGKAADLNRVRPDTFKQLDKSRAEVGFVAACGRCGGRGYYPTVQHGACYDCGGQSFYNEWAKLYTPERAEKMNAQNEKRRAKADEARRVKWEAQQVKEEAEAVVNLADNLEAYPGLKTVLDYEGDNDFLNDTARKARRFLLSEKQASASIDAVKREATKAEERANATPLTEGRQEFEGEVLTTKWVESDFGGCTKMLVKLDTGSKVWGTVPAAIDGRGELKGCRVKFTGTLKVSDDDNLFGFYSRPSKADVLEDAEGVA